MAASSDQIQQQESSHLSETSISTTSDLNVTQLNGDDGMVSRRFNAVMNKCIEKIMTAARQEKLNNCFGNIYKRNPEVFEGITKQFMQKLQTNIENEIKLMIKQEDLEFVFNKLSHMIVQYQDNPEEAWRPSGDPCEDTRNHVMQVKMKYKEQLDGMFEKLEKENKSLKDEVLQKREKVLASEKKIVSMSQDLTEVAEFCKEINTESLNEQIAAIQRK